MAKDNTEKNIQVENESILIKKVSELEALILKYKQLEDTLREALQKEYNDREKRITKQTDELIAANEQLKQEIIDRKKAEESLHYREEFERLITTLSTNFIRLSPEETDKAIVKALQTIGEFVGVERSYVFLFSESEDRIKIGEFFEWCAKGIKPQIQNLKNSSINKNFPWITKKIKRNGIFHFSSYCDLPKDASAEKEYFRSCDIKSLIAVPMFYKKSFIGYVGFDSISKEKTWPVDIIVFLRIVGEIFANALEHKKMETALLESKKKYKLLFECASDGIAVLDMDGNILDCNNAYTELIGYSKKEIKGKHASEFILDDYKKVFMDKLSCIEKDEKSESELIIVRKDEKTIPIWFKAAAIHDDSYVYKGTLIHYRDMTERKLTEEMLLRAHHEMKKRVIESTDTLINVKTQLNHEIAERKRAEDATKLAYAELDQIFNSAADGISVIDKDFTVLQINSTLSEIFSITKEESIGKKCYELFPSTLCHTSTCPIKMILNGKERVEIEIEIGHKKGSKVTCILTATPFRGNNNKLIGIIEDFKDMTEYKKTQDALSQQLMKYKQFIEISSDGFYITDSEGNLIDVNQAFSDFLGYSKEEFLCMKIMDLEADKPFNIRKLDKKTKIFETCYLHKNGKIIHVEVLTGLVNLGDDIFFVSSVRNITQSDKEKKHMEFLYSVLEHSKEGIALLDLNGCFLYNNSAFSSLLGYLPEELLGKHFSYCQNTLQEKFLGLDYSHIYEQHEFTGEYWYAKNNGKLFPTEFSKTFLKDINGNSIGKILSIKEITSTMRYNESAGSGIKTEKEFSTLLDNSHTPLNTIINKHALNNKENNKEGEYTDIIMDHKNKSALLKQIPKNIKNEYYFEGILGASECMKKLFYILPSVAESESTVLIQGESGTGKHLFAKAIHNLSLRKSEPFIVLNCGAFPDTLLESELFGYKAGAFTDAKKDKMGRFALADAGTLFLDEIGDISSAMQVRLLRFLQERVYEPLGSIKSHKADVRIIAATNKNLMDLVEDGKFRQDLFYRINVVKLELPPLRERLVDIPILVEHIIKRLNLRQNKKVKGITDDAIEYLISYNYPGNIRELENIIERAFVLCNTQRIRKEHLPKIICSILNNNYSNDKKLSSFMKIEAAYLMNALKENNWNRLETARQLGIHKATLFRKIKSLGLKIPPRSK